MSKVEIHHSDSPRTAERIAEFFDGVWAGSGAVVPFDVMLAAQHAGGYLAFAEAEGRIQAASFGFRGSLYDQTTLHSHVTASVLPGLGYKLKLHQADWARAQGIEGITWTFDPLVRRNCVFNFEKLGALGVEYLPNFYGSMIDSINRGDESDRFLAYWALDGRTASVPTLELQQHAVLAGEAGPVLQNFDDSSAFWVQLPPDIESLRRSNLSAALEWRFTVRSLLAQRIDSGWVAGPMSKDRTAFLVQPPQETIR